MQAIVVKEFGGPEVLQLAQAIVPALAAGQVRVRLYAAGVNPVDTYIRQGQYAMGLPKLPYTPGNDGAGVVDEVGAGVGGIAKGDRVFVAGLLGGFCSGTYAEMVVCSSRAVGLLPPGVPYSQGAGLGTPGLAACQALFGRARVQQGETVLVQGAGGGVGSLALQLAVQAGCRVIATAGEAETLALARSLGAAKVVNYHDENALAQIQAAAPAGVDVVVEVLANRNLAKDFEVLARYGRIVVVGSRGSLEFDPRLTMTKEAVVYGMNLHNMRPQEGAENVNRLAGALAKGMVVAVGRQLPLYQAAEAHRLVLEKAGVPGKIILEMP
ncbi:MAG: NADPH:quinone reductase [Oscillospiraceae bacterium]